MTATQGVIELAIARSLEDRSAVSLPYTKDRAFALIGLADGWSWNGYEVHGYGDRSGGSWDVHLRLENLLLKLRLLQHRITDPEYSVVKAAAYAAGVSVSEYVRAAALARATKPCPLCNGSGRRPRGDV